MFYLFSNIAIEPLLNLFRLHIDVRMYGLNGQLGEISDWLNHREKRWVNNVEYHRSSIDSGWSVWFTHMKLQKNS